MDGFYYNLVILIKIKNPIQEFRQSSVRVYSINFWGVIIARNLLPWDLEKIYSLEIVENDFCLGVASKKMPFFQKNVTRRG